MVLNRKYFNPVWLCLLIFQPAFCQVKLPRLVSDSMVLQRDTKIKIWGWASAGEQISIHFKDKKYTTVAASGGKWAIILPPAKAGGPYDMEIDASNHITVKNILIGDVWICSGQSNMELSMERLKDKYPAIVATAINPEIRQFIVATRFDFHSPREDLSSGNWQSVNHRSIFVFTGVGYFFASALYEKYHVPIGLIRSAAGGAPAEAWLSESTLKEFPVYLATLQRFKSDDFTDSIRKSDDFNNTSWYNNIWLSDKGLHEGKKWFDTSYDASSWQTMQVPGYWEDAGLPHTNGVVWFRKEINVPLSMTHKPARLFLGNIVDRDSVYLNGVFVGTTAYQYPPRKYDVPSTLLKEGKNIIVVRVINYTGNGGFYKDKPYKIIAAGEELGLAGEWKYKLGAASDSIAPSTFFQYKPGGLFNGMIAPLLNYSMKGVIWYQGEADAHKAKEYRKLFSTVIADWRHHWNEGDFPFLFAQLANYMPAKDQPSESQWAELREAQLQTLSVPKTAITVTIDIGEWNDLHPPNKEDVGKRLALAAERIAYGDKNIVYSGPIYQSMKIEGNKIIISFTNIGSGLAIKGSNDLKYFSIAGADGKFSWAKAKIAGNKVVVWNDDIKNPVVVRYAWADNPEGANLYNKEGLPASPFTTNAAAFTDSSKGLKDYYKNYFPIGVAVGPADISGDEVPLILRQFNSCTPENAMKMGPIHPKENQYYWRNADSIVDFAQKHGLRIRGHNLCWHEQTPGWLFRDSSGNLVTKDILLRRLKDHITTVVNRYKGKIYAWDVVNEAVADDSNQLFRNSVWYQVCGEDFIVKAFQYAHEADPGAKLFYNDYNTERPEKRERVYALLKKLIDAKVPINGIGLQGHWSVYEPSDKELRETIERFSSLGLEIQVTELDISVYPWEKNRRPRHPGETDAYTPELQREQSARYKKVFAIFREYRNVITGVTFWNVSDRHTWLDNYPVSGRKNYPLLFDQALQPKKAYEEVIRF